MARSKSAKPLKLDASMRIVVLHGKESMIQRLKLDELRQALETEFGEIEQHDIDGQSAELSDVLDELRSFSLMQVHKLVVVDECEDFVKRYRQALTRYAENPVDHATLVLRGQSWNKGNLDKAISRVGALVKCDEPKPGDAVTWLTKRGPKAHGRPITKAAAQALVERLGPSLGRLDTELAKLAVMVDHNGDQGTDAGRGVGGPSASGGIDGLGQGSIDDKLVRQVVGQSSDEQAYAVQEAVLGSLLRGDSRQAIEAVAELLDLSSQPEVLVMYFVADLMRKLAVGGAMRAQGASNREITEAVKIWGSRVDPFFETLERFGPDKAVSLLDQALAADRRSKSGFGQTRRNLEGFCAVMTDNP